METTICTWLHADDATSESSYYAVGSRSSTPHFQAVYWRCVAVFFATSVRNNPTARHRLYTNQRPAPVVDGLDVHRFLQRLGVEFVSLPFTYQPPPGYHPAWRNQFYLFDIVQHLAATSTAGDVLFVLDSDCFWINAATQMREEVRHHGLLTYDVGLPPGERQNGLTRVDMQLLYERLLERPLEAPPPYLGGEFYAATGAATQKVAEEIDRLWQTQLRWFAEGSLKFNEEAQALSFIYYRLGYATGTANRYIKRIWTTLLRSNNAFPEDYALTLWHVPAEKRYGIPRLFQAVRDPASPFWTLPVGKDLAAYLGRFLGIPQRSREKFLDDLRGAVRYKLRQKLGLDPLR